MLNYCIIESGVFCLPRLRWPQLNGGNTMNKGSIDQTIRDLATTYPIRWRSVAGLFSEYAQLVQFVWALTLLASVSNELWEEGLRREKGLTRFLFRAIGAGCSVFLVALVLFFRFIWTIWRDGSGWDRMKFRAWQLETIGSVFAKCGMYNFAIACHDIIEIRHHPDLTVRSHVWLAMMRETSFPRMVQLEKEIQAILETGKVNPRTRNMAEKFLSGDVATSSPQNMEHTIS